MADSIASSAAAASPSTVAIVNSGYAHLDDMLFQRVADKAREAGHAVRVFANNAALLSQPEAWPSIDVLFGIGTFRLNDDFLSRAVRLRGAVSAITGIEGFDLPLATRYGVAISNGGVPENSRSVAEATVLMLLSIFYDLNGAQTLLRTNAPRPLVRHTHMLEGRNVGFIGFGAIARQAANLLSTWGLQMTYYARSTARDEPPYIKRVELEELLRTSDAVVVLAPLNNDSFHLLNEERLGWMKRTAVLVNMARGALCDEAALYRCLARGDIAAAALDTFEVEPLPVDSPLRTLGNVVLTPHIIGHTADSHEAIERRAVTNVLALLNGQPPINPLNPEALLTSRWA